MPRQQRTLDRVPARRHRVHCRLGSDTDHPAMLPRVLPADWIIKSVPRIKMAEHLAARKDSTAKAINPEERTANFRFLIADFRFQL